MADIQEFNIYKSPFIPVEIRQPLRWHMHSPILTTNQREKKKSQDDTNVARSTVADVKTYE